MTRISARTSRCRSSARQGLTLAETLVATAVLTGLVTLWVPSLLRAREDARSVVCRDHLRRLGAGLEIHAQRHGGRFCSGAFDWATDGVVTEIGWVTDLKKLGIPPGKLLCPANPAQLAETFVDLVDADARGFDRCVDHFGSTAIVGPPSRGHVVNPCRWIAGAYPGGLPLAPRDPERVMLVEEEILSLGYNTNFSASWDLVRGELRLDDEGLPLGTSDCPGDVRARWSTTGSLTRELLESSGCPASLIPVLGDGAPGRPLPLDMGLQFAGSPTARSLVGNPILPPNSNRKLFPASPAGADDSAGDQLISAFAGFGAVHGDGERNILFADGSVRARGREGWKN